MTQFDPFYYWPAIQWDWWVGTVALVCCSLFTCQAVQKAVQKPAELLAEFGYGQANKDSSWAVLVQVLRYVAGYMVMTNVFALYYWYSINMAYAIKFMFLMEIGIVAALAYRAFAEDEKNGLCTKVSKENAKKNLKVYGAKAGALAVAGTFLWLELWNGTNYTKDAKHGLPEELTMMLGVVENKFLKGGHH